MGHSGTLKDLPTILLIEILSRLLRESLLQFKLVCKFWYVLIKDPTIFSLQHERIFIKWREIESPTYVRASKSHVASQMHHEGTYYWWAYKEGVTNIIHTFDMREEVFGKISVPNNIAEEREEYISMEILNGSIVIFHYLVSGNEKTFDNWEREKDVISWSKVMTISSLLGVEKPLLFVNSNELLIETNEGQVVYYNIKTHMTKVLPLKRIHVCSRQYLSLDKFKSIKSNRVYVYTYFYFLGS
ncbi:uncharacterized protein LOC111466331 [Cucurbita maxima]|uniref:Uncharacterized protein LOC111466331 n=1 Tax=Cucurbita maxima TaxID=3661 RepID=A0A6J1HNP9_CUCMA|nr:uncharacterized protein LOC111466331 [Cucurbita maxima]